MQRPAVPYKEQRAITYRLVITRRLPSRQIGIRIRIQVLIDILCRWAVCGIAPHLAVSGDLVDSDVIDEHMGGPLEF